MKSSPRHHVAPIAFTLVLAWSAAAHAQIEWTHYSTEAVLQASFTIEPWSGSGVWTPNVIRAEGDTLKMWYAGGNAGRFANQIGYAWSLDGVDWTRHPNNPVIVPEGLDPVVWTPRVLTDGDTLRMWYAEGNLETIFFVIRYATSTDGGVTWDVHPTPVMEPGPPGTWNQDAVRPGDVIQEDGVFKMWFSGGTGPFTPIDSTTAHSIGYATSLDGIAWTLYDDPATTEAPFQLSDPVLMHGSSAEFDYRWAQAATVLRTDEGYELWYDGKRSIAEPAAMGYATSPDGIVWTKHPANPVLTSAGAPLAQQLLHPTVLFYGGLYHMWLSLFGNDPPAFSHIGYATAPVTVAAEPGAPPPEAYSLQAPYPNPTAAGATLTYRLNEAARVTLTVHDLLGREVARLVDGARPAGAHSTEWDGRDARGQRLSAGVFVVTLRAGDRTESRQVILLR